LGQRTGAHSEDWDWGGGNAFFFILSVAEFYSRKLFDLKNVKKKKI